MPKIRCHYLDCKFLDENYCSAAVIQVDPDTGCETYDPMKESQEEDKWDQDDDEIQEWYEIEEDDEDDNLWPDDTDF
ncbi:MAG: DUF1540 domain-containing protein [Anaerolineaceae bacterium]|nr:DUF1540 domain-containing protein [Anaerolineaceae bacterium]